MTRRIYIRELLTPKLLGERQERMMRGLLNSGVPLDQIKALAWYEEELERFYVDNRVDTVDSCVDSVDTPVDNSGSPDPNSEEGVGADPDIPISNAEARRRAYKREHERKRRAEKRGG